MKYTDKSTIRDVLKSPLGCDIVHTVLKSAGLSFSLAANPVVGHIRLSALPFLSRGTVGQDFVDTIISLLNMSPEESVTPARDERRAWWKECVFYQVYPRSFCDSNGDGIGDIEGIRSKLDYIQSLGVGAIWLNPVYDSPNDDMGYDIRDYRKIMAEFGTMRDFDELLSDVHSRGMKLIMDLVVNHTSDEHKWFRESVKGPNNPYGDYYIWRDGDNGGPPNNWTSFFSGSAWSFYPERRKWALHLFSSKQMDLNWDNSAVRRDVAETVRWWLDKGVDGFRMDVINLISKADFADGSPLIGDLVGVTGIEHYFYGPRLHKYLHELVKNSFAHYDAVSVGETPGIGRECAALLTHESRGELNMIFNFDHLETPGHVRWDDYEYDLRYLKRYYTEWQLSFPKGCTMPLFFENHDNPRMVSKVRPDGQYRDEIAKLLLMMQLTLRGTPFVYQGQELALGNTKFVAIEELRDVESLNLYNELLKTLTREEALAEINAGSRDHARTPMPWTGDAPSYGFTDGTPWLRIGDDAPARNVAREEGDEHSTLAFFRQATAFRRAHVATIAYGPFVPVGKNKNVFSYIRRGDGEALLFEANLTDTPQRRARLRRASREERLLTNYEGNIEERLRPYEAAVWRLKGAS